MLTTGSKLYLGSGRARRLSPSACSAGRPVGRCRPRWARRRSSIVFLFLGGLMLYVRDADVYVPPAADETPPRRRPATRPGRSWPRFGAALAAIGMALDTRLFIAGIVVVGLAILEWAVQSWADRASADPVYNDRVRGRLMHPLEFPVAGLLGGGLIVFGFSRVMVALSKDRCHSSPSPSLGLLVMGVAVILGTRPQRLPSRRGRGPEHLGRRRAGRRRGRHRCR